MPKNAEIIACGSELLTPQRTDTNSLAITQHLNSLGVEVIQKSIVGDDHERLTSAIRGAMERADVVIVCGGLGPTEDDVTREAAAAALGRKLVLSLEQESVLIARFRQLNRPMAKNNLKQAYLIEGAQALPNPNGSAPGQFVSTDRGALALLPGPPRELVPMVENELLPRLRHVLPPEVILVRSFRIAGMGESDLDTLIAPVYTKYTNPVTTILSAPGDLFVHLRVRSDSRSQAETLLREVGNPIADLLGDRVYTTDPEEGLETVVARMLRQKNVTISTAESCTGGLLSGRLTETPGSSNFFKGGFVTYSDGQKREVLGVPADLIAKYSAVSEPVAAAMAKGARALTGSTYALATTGYAGPDGGTDYDPVGTVFLALAGPNGTEVRRVRYTPDRWRVRILASQSALDMLRLELLKQCRR